MNDFQKIDAALLPILQNGVDAARLVEFINATKSGRTDVLLTALYLTGTVDKPSLPVSVTDSEGRTLTLKNYDIFTDEVSYFISRIETRFFKIEEDAKTWAKPSTVGSELMQLRNKSCSQRTQDYSFESSRIVNANYTDSGENWLKMSKRMS